MHLCKQHSEEFFQHSSRHTDFFRSLVPSTTVPRNGALPLKSKCSQNFQGLQIKIPSLVSMVGDIEKSSKKIDGFFRLGHEPSNIRLGSFIHRGNCTLTAALFGRFWPTELLDWGRIDCRCVHW